MLDLLSWLNSTFYDGLPYSIVTLSFVLTFKYIRFPDVTCAGTFVLGAATAAIAVVYFSVNPYIAIGIACFAGAAGGALTALFHSVLRIERLLAGILSAFSLYSINLMLLHPTLPYGTSETVFSPIEPLDRAITWGNMAWHPLAIVYFFFVVVLLKLILDRFLVSEIGLAMRALEDEEAGEPTLRRRGSFPGSYKALGLVLGNALVGIAGALVSMKEGAANAHRGFDVLITGLIAYMVGIQFQRWLALLGEQTENASNTFWIKPLSALKRVNPTTAAVAGAVLYFGLIALAQRINVPPEVTKLLLAVYVAATVGDLRGLSRSLTRLRARFAARRMADSSEANGKADARVASLRGIRFRYATGEVDVLRGVNLEIQAGELVGLEGGNGCGKTTLLRLLTGILPDPDNGSLILAGRDLTYDPGSRLREVGYVDQNPQQAVVGTLTVEENLALAGVGASPSFWRRALSKERKQDIRRLFSSTEFPIDFLHRDANNLSGGQRQVVNILSLLAREKLPRLILLDEPLNNLDMANAQRCLAVIKEMRKKGASIVIVSHATKDGLLVDRVVNLEQVNAG